MTALLLTTPRPLVAVEYRGYKSENIQWLDQKTGKVVPIAKRSIMCELADGTQATLDVRQERGQLDEVETGMTKGQRYLVPIVSITQKMGHVSITVEHTQQFQLL